MRKLNLKDLPESLQKRLYFSFLNIDKPSGITSFEVVKRIMDLLPLKKAGHLGTLDPKVTGVLPIALNRSCRLVPFLMKKFKTYRGIIRVHREISINRLEKEAKKFRGKIKQIPPRRSKVKRVLREREVKRFEILRQVGKKDFEFIAEVEGGTYIRKLCDDLGKNIGGAHMLKLRRLKAGVFSAYSKTFITLDGLQKVIENKNFEILEKVLIPAEEIIKKSFPVLKIKVPSLQLKQILNGKPLFKNFFTESYLKKFSQLKEGETFAVFSRFPGERKEKFVEIAKKSRLIEDIGKPLFVFN